MPGVAVYLSRLEIIRLVETVGRIGGSNVRDILWKQRKNLASNVQHAGEDVHPQADSLSDSKIELTRMFATDFGISEKKMERKVLGVALRSSPDFIHSFRGDGWESCRLECLRHFWGTVKIVGNKCAPRR